MRIPTHPHCTYGTCGVLHCLLFCDQTRPNLRISLVGYHCAIEFPCGVLLFYCCKYPTTYMYGVRVHTVHMALVGYFIVFSFVTKPGQTLEFFLWGTIVPLNFLAGYYCCIVASTPQPMAYAFTQPCKHRQTGSSHCSSFVYTRNIFATPLICFVHVWQTGAFFQLGTLLFLLL